MTVRELNVYAQAAGQLRRQEQELTEVNIYSMAMALRACLFAKHAPALETLFPRHGGREKGEAMDDDALYRQVAALNRMFGGEEN
nr:MAG TPA: hypothetical protein [Caudoviricetes sp.]